MGNSTAIQVVEGSLLSVVNSQNTSIADAFMSVDAVVIMDESGSMGMCDSRGGKSRFLVGCEELANLQRNRPGKYLVIGFSSDVQTRIGGVPVEQGGGTDMVKALRYAREFDVQGMNFFLVSDGEPDDLYSGGAGTLAEAAKYRNHINTIFCGPESDSRSRDFLNRLANSTGGKSATAERVMELAATVETLMLGSGG
jgi:hypothetical protein